MMNEGQFIALRSYAEEQSSLLRQVLEEQKRMNELLERIAPKPQEPVEIVVKEPKAAAKKGKGDGKPAVKPAVGWNS